MADTVAEKIAEAQQAMFGNMTPTSGKIIMLVKGDVIIESQDGQLEIRKD